MARVLVVDDEANVRTLVRRVLTTFGYEVIEAENGQTALAHVHENQPDLIFIDLAMPEMNGFQLIEHLENEFPHVPVIVMSAYPDQVRKARQKGTHHTLPKPFVYGDLIAL